MSLRPAAASATAAVVAVVVRGGIECEQDAARPELTRLTGHSMDAASAFDASW